MISWVDRSGRLLGGMEGGNGVGMGFGLGMWLVDWCSAGMFVITWNEYMHRKITEQSLLIHDKKNIALSKLCHDAI